MFSNTETAVSCLKQPENPHKHQKALLCFIELIKTTVMFNASLHIDIWSPYDKESGRKNKLNYLKTLYLQILLLDFDYPWGTQNANAELSRAQYTLAKESL